MSTRAVYGRILIPMILSMLAAPSFRAAAQDGIYADFTTSLGNFTCKLDYTVAPVAVANFIGLATGEQTWVDMKSGRVRNDRFYDGMIFHRVIAGFMIQTGSPNREGTDGPGYVFQDEFDSSVRFNAFGLLAMANPGTPDANGSQFFVTATNNTSWLNDRHTIFGKLASGSNVVYAISRVATNPDDDKPLSDVILHRVDIRRVGNAALAFDIRKQGLPTMANSSPRIQRASGTDISLGFPITEYSITRIFSSGNLRDWDQETWRADVADPQTNKVQLARDGSTKFYTVAQGKYPAQPYAAANLFKRKLVLKVTSGGSGSITINFDDAGKGTFSYSGSNGTVTSYKWSQHFFGGGDLWPIEFSKDVFPLYIRLYQKSATSGEFRGWTLNPVKGWQALSGTLTLSAPQ